jgi:hypothetical protein
MQPGRQQAVWQCGALREKGTSASVSFMEVKDQL